MLGCHKCLWYLNLSMFYVSGLIHFIKSGLVLASGMEIRISFFSNLLLPSRNILNSSLPILITSVWDMLLLPFIVYCKVEFLFVLIS